MSWSRILTRLPLDEYARIMAIPGWLFNQIRHPERAQRGICAEVMFQSGYSIDPNRILGRDEIATAIVTAEMQVDRLLGYPYAAMYICRDEVQWPRPKRGIQAVLPIIETHYGGIIEPGIEAWDLLTSTTVTYTDEDEDGVLDWATVVVNLAAFGLTCDDRCDIEIVPSGLDPPEWMIRPLRRSCTGNVLTFEGPRWLFVEPKYLLQPLDLTLEEDNYFLGTDVYPYEGGIDVYHHYTNPATQAEIVWAPGVCGPTCGEICQVGCMTVQDARVGHVTVQPGIYTAATETWAAAVWSQCLMPTSVRLWYKAGYTDPACARWCELMSELVKQAIVRLANTHMIESPCGCQATKERFERDHEEMGIDSTDVKLTQTAFGSSMRGALFAYNVFSKLPPLGMGG